jgi:hypothetical protein
MNPILEFITDSRQKKPSGLRLGDKSSLLSHIEAPLREVKREASA